MRWAVVFLGLCFLRSAEAWCSSAPVAGLLRHEARREMRAAGLPSARGLYRRYAPTQSQRQQQQQQHSGVRTGAGKARMAAVMMSSAEKDVVDGDIVVVAGASGGVGRLVALSLASTGKYKVKALVRNLEKAKEVLAEGLGPNLELVQGNIVDEDSLNAAMENAVCVVTCTGTTAFPSARWGRGNTPDAVDNVAVGNMLRAAAAPSNHPDGGKLKRFVFLSSVGVERADKFPFLLVNACGVLDAKAKGEAAVRRAASEGGFSFSIVRPGQISGGAFASYFSAEGRSTKMETEAPSGRTPKRMVSLRQGDEQAGRINPSSVAAVFTQVVGQSGAAGKSFTAVNVLGATPTQEEWDTMFSEL